MMDTIHFTEKCRCRHGAGDRGITTDALWERHLISDRRGRCTVIKEQRTQRIKKHWTWPLMSNILTSCLDERVEAEHNVQGFKVTIHDENSQAWFSCWASEIGEGNRAAFAGALVVGHTFNMHYWLQNKEHKEPDIKTNLHVAESASACLKELTYLQCIGYGEQVSVYANRQRRQVHKEILDDV